MSNVLILASQHGDEYSGEKLYSYIQDAHAELLPHITYILANPKARAQRMRFVETDMNRSYTNTADTYEQRQANKVMKLVDSLGVELVLDMHTTTVEQPPCLIVKSLSAANEPFLRATSIPTIVVMNNSIADSSINRALPQAISVEVNENVSDELLEELCQDIRRYLANEVSAVNKQVYEVTGLIDKKELAASDIKKLRNFEMSEYGYYPVLVGENSYSKFTNFRGFKASRRYNFKV